MGRNRGLAWRFLIFHDVTSVTFDLSIDDKTERSNIESKDII